MRETSSHAEQIRRRIAGNLSRLQGKAMEAQEVDDPATQAFDDLLEEIADGVQIIRDRVADLVKARGEAVQA